MFRVHVTLLWVKVVHTMLCTVVYECGCVCVCVVCVCVSAGEQDNFILSCKAGFCLVFRRKLLMIDAFTMLNS